MRDSTGSIAGSLPSTEMADSQAALSQQSIICALRTHPEPWLRTAKNRLGAVGKLGLDWDSYGALPVNRNALDFAETYLRYLASVVGVPPPNLGATPRGHVGLTWDAGAWSLDASVDETGLISYVYMDERDHRNDRESRTREIGQLVTLLAQWN